MTTSDQGHQRYLKSNCLEKKLLDSRLQRPEAHQNDIRKRGTKRPFFTKIIWETTRGIERFRVIDLLHGLSTDWDHRPTIEPVAPTVRCQGQTVTTVSELSLPHPQLGELRARFSTVQFTGEKSGINPIVPTVFRLMRPEDKPIGEDKERTAPKPPGAGGGTSAAGVSASAPAVQIDGSFDDCPDSGLRQKQRLDMTNPKVFRHVSGDGFFAGGQ